MFYLQVYDTVLKEKKKSERLPLPFNTPHKKFNLLYMAHLLAIRVTRIIQCYTETGSTISSPVLSKLFSLTVTSLMLLLIFFPFSVKFSDS